MTNSLPSNRVESQFSGEIIRSCTSLAANYRAACRLRALKTVS
ncbi:MAG: hypothetical protein EAY75_17220 [Bacteroidetes bacterium]|nr:MAG: hypothetical protein EAY75_17220 [Bacteroidota bacterium]